MTQVIAKVDESQEIIAVKVCHEYSSESIDTSINTHTYARTHTHTHTHTHSQVTVWQGATRGAGYSDLDQADLGVEAQVERLRVTLSFRFINRMKVSLE